MKNMTCIEDRIIECNMCKDKGSITTKEFIHIIEGEPIPFMDYVVCQNCGYKQLM